MAASEIENSFQQLLSGIAKFQREIYPEREETYKQVIREGQKPHALFITCADSRIDPEALTQSGPGEIFVLRNIGNLVPAYGEMMGGVSAVIEYAVLALNVSQVIICGHTDCGAMKGLLSPEKLTGMPLVKSWLRNGEAALSIVQARHQSEEQSIDLNTLIEENVLLQLNHLRTHPSVAGRIAQGSLAVYGCVYEIEHGTVRFYDEAQRKFLPYEHFLATSKAESANG